VIDLHTHILPAIDDGPSGIRGSLDLARRAVEEGVLCMVATPHVAQDPTVTPDRIAEGVAELADLLYTAGIPLEVLPGAEIALSRLLDLDDAALRGLSLAGGPWLLVECPFTAALGDFEPMVYRLQARGYRILLAHPERSAALQRQPERVAQLVASGALVQITAGSLAGDFGTTVRRFTLRLLRDGLVHVVASDAHDTRARPPGVERAFAAAEPELPGVSELRPWLTEDVPGAIVVGEKIPPAPDFDLPPGTRWRRFRSRARSS